MSVSRAQNLAQILTRPNPLHQAMPRQILARLVAFLAVLAIIASTQLHAGSRLSLKQALENPSQVNAKNFPFRDFYALILMPMLLSAGNTIAINGNECKGEDDDLSCKAESIALLGDRVAKNIRYSVETKDERAQSTLKSTLTLPCDKIFQREWLRHPEAKRKKLQNLACSILPDALEIEQDSKKKLENDFMESKLELKLSAPNGSKLTIEFTEIDRTKDFAGHNMPAIYAIVYSSSVAKALRGALESLGSRESVQTPDNTPKLLDHTSTITRFKVLLESKTLGDDIYTLAAPKQSKQDYYRVPKSTATQAPQIELLGQAVEQFMLGKTKRMGILFEAGEKGGISYEALDRLPILPNMSALIETIQEIERYGELSVITH